MALTTYRYRLDAPVSQTVLRAEAGLNATVLANSQALVQNIETDDTEVDDLDAAMTRRGWSRIVAAGTPESQTPFVQRAGDAMTGNLGFGGLYGPTNVLEAVFAPNSAIPSVAGALRYNNVTGRWSLRDGVGTYDPRALASTSITLPDEANVRDLSTTSTTSTVTFSTKVSVPFDVTPALGGIYLVHFSVELSTTAANINYIARLSIDGATTAETTDRVTVANQYRGFSGLAILSYGSPASHTAEILFRLSVAGTVNARRGNLAVYRAFTNT